MKLQSRNHVYRYLPNFLDNRKLTKSEEQIVIGLKVVPMAEQDIYRNQKELNFVQFAPDKAQEENDRLLKDTVKGKVEFIDGLVIEGINDDGRKLTFDEFYAEAPPEMVAEVCRAVMSTTILSQGEQKNF